MVRLVMTQWRARWHELRSKSRLEDGGLVMVATQRWDLRALVYGQVARTNQEGGSSDLQQLLRPEGPFKSTKST